MIKILIAYYLEKFVFSVWIQVSIGFLLCALMFHGFTTKSIYGTLLFLGIPVLYSFLVLWWEAKGKDISSFLRIVREAWENGASPERAWEIAKKNKEYNKCV